MWTSDNCTSRYPSCPVCCSEERRSSDLESGEIGFYSRTMLESWNIDVETLFARLQMWRCGRCDTLWYDPWFSNDFASCAYTTVIGRHKYGWAALRNWVTGTERTYFFGRPRLLSLILDALGSFSSYGEINCPFSGLFFEILGREDPDFDKQLINRWLSALMNTHRSTEFVPSYEAARQFAAIGPALPRWGSRTVERTLLIENSPICWGSSCSFGGVNCQAVALGPLLDRVSTFDQLEKTGRRLDALGIFNTLDHFPDPIAVLLRALRCSDLVLLDLHRWGWMDAQHHFNIGTGLGNELRDRGVSVLDVSAHVTENGRHGDDRRYLVCSLEMDLAPITERLGINLAACSR